LVSRVCGEWNESSCRSKEFHAECLREERREQSKYKKRRS
jgi:hypothetical protein